MRPAAARAAGALAALALASVALAVGGCGGSSEHAHAAGDRGAKAGETGGEADRGAVRGIAQADQLAYYQLATASGFLCASAGTAAAPHTGPDRARQQLAGAAQRLSAVHPGNAELKTALGVLGMDLTRWRSAGGARARRRLAPGVLADCRRVQDSLTRFLTGQRRSGLSARIPD